LFSTVGEHVARPAINARTQIALFPVRVARCGNRRDTGHIIQLTAKMAGRLT
jgi:hypothetical protein